jgi:2-polyprenyl-3-methyl-5-hydroxy-6-metoxy-1,4-benzoquinol methylase
MDISQRSYQKELLDEEYIPQKDLWRNLYELNIINRMLGGHAATIKGLDQLKLKKDRMYQILDIGSGGGDTLKAIAIWGRGRGYQFELTGVDLKQDCIDYGQKFCKKYQEIHFIKSDYKDLDSLDRKFDIIITSLFCHHLNDEELKGLFDWSVSHAETGFIMNDLHRHPVAYHSISILTKLFSRSYLVKNDAKLSVLRGFKLKEIEEFVSHIQAKTQKLFWCWPFRWVLVIRK